MPNKSEHASVSASVCKEISIMDRPKLTNLQKIGPKSGKKVPKCRTNEPKGTQDIKKFMCNSENMHVKPSISVKNLVKNWENRAKMDEMNEPEPRKNIDRASGAIKKCFGLNKNKRSELKSVVKTPLKRGKKCLTLEKKSSPKVPLIRKLIGFDRSKMSSDQDQDQVVAGSNGTDEPIENQAISDILLR